MTEYDSALVRIESELEGTSRQVLRTIDALATPEGGIVCQFHQWLSDQPWK
jgi:hypothetical protein